MTNEKKFVYNADFFTERVAEWFKAHAWKACKPFKGFSGVRIPPSPPFISSHKFVCVQKSPKIQKVMRNNCNKRCSYKFA